MNTGKLKKEPPLLAHDWKAEDLVRLYVEVMAKQNNIVGTETRKQITALVDLVKSGFGEIIAYKDNETEQVIAALLLLYGKGVVNLVLNLVSDSWRNTGLSSWMVYNSIKEARNKGAHCYDFNGANSPQRGDDKHSYGAKPVLYFTIRYPDGN